MQLKWPKSTNRQKLKQIHRNNEENKTTIDDDSFGPYDTHSKLSNREFI